jgi:hypothetical protein
VLLQGPHVSGCNFGVEIVRYVSYDHALAEVQRYFEKSQIFSALKVAFDRSSVIQRGRAKLDLGFVLKVISEAYRFSKGLDLELMGKSYEEIMSSKTRSFPVFMHVLNTLYSRASTAESLLLFNELLKGNEALPFGQFIQVCNRTGYYLHFAKLIRDKAKSDSVNKLKAFREQF